MDQLCRKSGTCQTLKQAQGDSRKALLLSNNSVFHHSLLHSIFQTHSSPKTGTILNCVTSTNPLSVSFSSGMTGRERNERVMKGIGDLAAQGSRRTMEGLQLLDRPREPKPPPSNPDGKGKVSPVPCDPQRRPGLRPWPSA